MVDVTDKALKRLGLTGGSTEAAEANHDAWAKEKIRTAVTEDAAHPEKRIDEKRMWEKLDLGG